MDERYVHAHNNWGLALAAQKQYDEAIKQYRAALDIDANHFRAYRNWGDALCERRNYLGATEQYLKALELDPAAVDFTKWVDCLERLGSKQRKQREDALSRIATAGGARYANAHNGWGFALYNRKRYPEAIELLPAGSEAGRKIRLRLQQLGLGAGSAEAARRSDQAVPGCTGH